MRHEASALLLWVLLLAGEWEGRLVEEEWESKVVAEEDLLLQQEKEEEKDKEEKDREEKEG
jgi:hypothetical protein